MEVFSVVLAGGSGTRFWPKSRVKTPKQLIALGDSSKTMLEQALSRLDGVVPTSHRYVVTREDQYEETKRVAGKLCAGVVVEPDGRNTAAAMLLGMLNIKKHTVDDQKAIVISVHADSYVRDEVAYRNQILQAVQYAGGGSNRELGESGSIVLLGLEPSEPATGFGYIERGDEIAKGLWKVRSFKEKPTRQVAESYLASGKYLWNSGIFVFPLALMLEEFNHYLPEIFQPLVDSRDLRTTYRKLPHISIDEGVIEKSNRVSVMSCAFSWSDLGSWNVLGEVFGTDTDGNFTSGDVLLVETKNSVIETDGSLVAVLGVDDLVVVQSKGVVLVCPRSRAQDVKKLVDILKSQGRFEYI